MKEHYWSYFFLFENIHCPIDIINWVHVFVISTYLSGIFSLNWLQCLFVSSHVMKVTSSTFNVHTFFIETINHQQDSTPINSCIHYFTCELFNIQIAKCTPDFSHYLLMMSEQIQVWLTAHTHMAWTPHLLFYEVNRNSLYVWTKRFYVETENFHRITSKNTLYGLIYQISYSIPSSAFSVWQCLRVGLHRSTCNSSKTSTRRCAKCVTQPIT